VRNLSKSFGPVAAVNDLSFDVAAGTITGFVGPNGSGKTTTMRMMLGLVRPDAGSALFDGQTYTELDNPCARVGAVLEATSFHPDRTARDHLRLQARATGVEPARCDELLTEVDLAGAANRPIRGFSLGMRQRLGLATALVARPPVLILDEPTNGLDPEGVHWLRGLLRQRADAGATVLVSSHLLAELALSADAVVVIKSGHLITQGTVAEITGRLSADATDLETAFLSLTSQEREQ
jgi:ABC-2 type transport system ATP-binding protein